MRFWITAPMDYEPVSGTFTIDPQGSPPLMGRGYVGANLQGLGVHLEDEVTGSINAGNHTWQANYTQSHLGSSIDVHLEGTFEGVP